jgi:hypothetical protein
MDKPPTPSIFRKAHGNAKDLGTELVAETPVLDELPPPDPNRTVTALAIRGVRGRPFQKGNTAASGRGASLTRINIDPDAPEEHRKVHRKATSLQNQRRRELEIQCGGPVSSAVKVEIVAWARATAWAEWLDRSGDYAKAVVLTEKASGHQLKAIAIAEREAQSRPQEQFDPLKGVPLQQLPDVEAEDLVEMPTDNDNAVDDGIVPDNYPDA